jgi:hypothetical protein
MSIRNEFNWKEHSVPWIDSAGYRLLKQTERSSCGMACVTMVVHRHTSVETPESMLVNKSKGMAGGYGQAIQDRFKGQPRMLTATKDPTPSKGYEGTYMKNLSNCPAWLDVPWQRSDIQPRRSCAIN